MVIDRTLVVVAEVESVTRKVGVSTSAAVGVPLITPVEAFRVKPGGRCPRVIAQVYGPVPPVAANDVE